MTPIQHLKPKVNWGLMKRRLNVRVTLLQQQPVMLVVLHQDRAEQSLLSLDIFSPLLGSEHFVHLQPET